MKADASFFPAALVTGGARGIGRAIGETLLENGWNVAALDVAEPEADFDPRIRFIQGDVAYETAVADAIRQAVAAFGGLNGLVNNAGIGIGKPLGMLALEEWNRVIATNLTGMFLCLKHAEPHLRAAKGAVVNIASTRAHQSEKHTEAYSASKGGVVALTHAAAASLGPEIRVNCISPGWIDTRPDALARQSEEDRTQHPCGRVGSPADVAGLVAYLLSDRAGFITGQEFVVDGGMTKKMIYAE